MGTDRKKVILFDMDMTLVDSSIAKQYGKNYKEVQKHISEFSVYDGIKEVIEQLSEQYIIYVVSGNVGSTIKKVIHYFNLNIPLENVYGYRQGYPMENLARKKKVMQVAIDNILQTHNISKSDIVYIGDEVDDYKYLSPHDTSSDMTIKAPGKGALLKLYPILYYSNDPAEGRGTFREVS